MRGSDPAEEAWYHILLKSDLTRQALERTQDSLMGVRQALEALHRLLDAMPRSGHGKLMGKAEASTR